MKMHKWTDEEYGFLLEHVPGHHIRDVVYDFNNKFNLNLSYGQICAYCKRKKIKTGNDTRFKKGNIPKNKGMKITEETRKKVEHTFFKPGNIPHNLKPVGTEVIKQFGIYVKVKEPNVWEYKHRIVWKKHYGEIPEGHVITFKDGDNTNCDISNLLCVKRNAIAMLGREKLIVNQNKEIAILYARLKIAISEQSKKRRKYEA